MASILLLLLLLLSLFWVSETTAQHYDYQALGGKYYTLGGEKAIFHVTPFKDATYANYTNSNRHNFCEKYELVRTGELPLKDALRGMEITTLMHKGQYFHYTEETGIDPEYPGLSAHLMDMIAYRAGFTWRNSFAFAEPALTYNMIWTEYLWWGVNTYDIDASWWEHSLTRMEMGITYMEPWYDGSIILVDKLRKEELETWDINIIFNWSRPFDLSVWILILVTVLISALVYQLIEYLEGEQQDRPMGQWFSDNLYLSILNGTSNFEYAPSSAAGRIFAVSMALWALVITATYTANLTNLFVDDTRPRPAVTSMEQAVAKRTPICTYEGTNSDLLLKKWYKTAVRRPKPNELEMFKALKTGECELVAVSKSGWWSFQGKKAYNPHCDIIQVGETVDEIRSGFAIKADVGYKCTSLLRDVFNLYFQQLIDEGELFNAWEVHLSRIHDINCKSADEPDTISSGNDHSDDDYSEYMGDGETRNLLHGTTIKLKEQPQKRSYQQRRKLKGATQSNGAASSGPVGGDETALTLEQMMGTFIFHYAQMLVAILVSLVSPFYTKLTRYLGWEQPEKFIVRSHGPTVGPPPSVETDSPQDAKNPRRRGTVIQAYGSPIGRRKRMSINTYVLPKNKRTPLDTTTEEERTREEFLDELDAIDFSNSSVTEMEKSCGGSAKRCQQEPVINARSLARLREHFDAKLQKTTEQYEERLSQYEANLNQQMSVMMTMLLDMRNRDGQRDQELRLMLGILNKLEKENHTAEVSSALGLRWDKVPTAMEGQQTNGKREFGQYLRQTTAAPATATTSTQKRDFGRYLRHHSQPPSDER